jgi:hypothetical protein
VDPPDKLPMPAMASNRMVLEEFIRKHYMTSVFNACKRQHCPVTAGPATHENPHLRGCCSRVLQDTDKGSYPLYGGGTCRSAGGCEEGGLGKSACVGG